MAGLSLERLSWTSHAATAANDWTMSEDTIDRWDGFDLTIGTGWPVFGYWPQWG